MHPCPVLVHMCAHLRSCIIYLTSFPWKPLWLIQFSSCRVWLSVTLCTPGSPVHHQLSEFTQTNVHWAGGAIYLVLCRPLLLLPSGSLLVFICLSGPLWLLHTGDTSFSLPFPAWHGIPGHRLTVPALPPSFPTSILVRIQYESQWPSSFVFNSGFWLSGSQCTEQRFSIGLDLHWCWPPEFPAVMELPLSAIQHGSH